MSDLQLANLQLVKMRYARRGELVKYEEESRESSSVLLCRGFRCLVLTQCFHACYADYKEFSVSWEDNESSPRTGKAPFVPVYCNR